MKLNTPFQKEIIKSYLISDQVLITDKNDRHIGVLGNTSDEILKRINNWDKVIELLHNIDADELQMKVINEFLNSVNE